MLVKLTIPWEKLEATIEDLGSNLVTTNLLCGLGK